jgi:signal transduction histidine kinase
VSFKIESETLANQRASLVLTVTDSGVGIAEDKISSILIRFLKIQLIILENLVVLALAYIL